MSNIKVLLILTLLLSTFLANAQVKDSVATFPVDTVTFTSSLSSIPQFAGGNEAYRKYMTKNLKYPAKDRKENIQGIVMIGFIVEKDGTLTDITVERGLTIDMDKEALRLVSNFPKCIPGTVSGRPVRAKVIIPVRFELTE